MFSLKLKYEGDTLLYAARTERCWWIKAEKETGKLVREIGEKELPSPEEKSCERRQFSVWLIPAQKHFNVLMVFDLCRSIAEDHFVPFQGKKDNHAQNTAGSDFPIPVSIIKREDLPYP